MSDEPDNPVLAEEVEPIADAIPEGARDPLRDVLKLRRAIRFGVYTIITADLPFYYFALGYTLSQVAAVGIIGWIIALVAVETAFRQMIRLRKRSAYPNVLLVEMGVVNDTALAAQRGLDVVVSLLGVRAAVIGLRGSGGRLRLAACRGLSDSRADEILMRSEDAAGDAMAQLQPVRVKLAAGEPFHEAFGLVPDGANRIVFAPVIALQNAIGVIVLASDSRDADINDDQLISGIGIALGLSLENLRQRDQLRDGQERLERVVTGAPLVLFALDRDGVYTLVEGRGLEVLGTRPEQVLGRSIFDIFNGRTEITDAVKRALAGEEVIVSADFSGAVFEARLTPLTDAGGQVAGVIGVAIDVTERRQAEDALHASQEQLGTMVSNVPVILFAMDSDGNFTLSEGKGLAALGLKAGQVVGLNVRDVYGDHPEIVENIERALGGEVVADTVEVNGLFWETIYSPVRDASGAVVSVIGVAGNVTERMRAQEALSASEERYRALVENASDGIFVIGMDNRFISVNAAEAVILGYDPEELIGRDVNEVIVPEHRNLADAMTARKLESGGQTAYEILAIRKDGSFVPLEISSWLAYEDGKPVAIHGIARDVSERKRVETALREGEERYRELFDNASDVVYTHDLAGRFTSINKAAERVTGYSPDEAVGMNIAAIVAPDHLQRAVEMTRKKVKEGGETTYEIDIITKDGRRIPLEVSTRIILRDGKPFGVQGIARDINARKRAEEALRESEELYRTLVETSPDAVILTTVEGVIIKVNRPAARLLGFESVDEMVGMKAPDFVADGRWREIEEKIETSAGGGIVRNIAQTLARRDGTLVPVEISISSLTDANGVPRAFVGVVRDVTERRKAEDALRESEEKYRDLVENSNEIIYTLDASGIISYISPAVRQLGGYEPEDVVGKTSLSFVHPEDLPELAASFQRTIGGSPEPSEYRLRTKSGEYVWVQTSSKPIYDGDEIVGLRGLIVDIDQRKRAEHALDESEDRYRELFENASDLVYTHDLGGKYISVNKAVEQITGYTQEETLAMTWSDVIAQDHRPRLAELAAALAAGAVSTSFEIDVITKDGRRVPLEVRPQLVFRDGVPVAIRGIARDITQRRRADALLGGEKRILEMIASGAKLPEVLEQLTRIMEDQSTGMLCSVLLLDHDGENLRLGAASSLPEDYNRAIDGLAIGPNVGSCGTAAYKKELVVVTDIASDPLWVDFKDLALAAGLQACWSVPILSTRGDVLGTFAVYYGEPRVPRPEDIELIQRATHIAGIAIERKQAEEALQASEERYRKLVNTAQDVIYTLGLDASFTSLNPAFETVTGWKPEDWLGKNFGPLVHPDDVNAAVDQFKEVLSGEAPSYELRIKRADGDYVVGEFTSSPIVEDGEVKGVFGIARDITERKKAEALIRELAYHDGLTGLPNRALFEDRLGVALAQAHRSHQMLAVMFLDLDRFKTVNDTLGHGGGDKLLKGVAEDLKTIVREGDTVARVGGDEFTVLLPGIELREDATEIAQRILDVLRGPRLIEGQEFSVSASIGVTLYPHDGADTDTLLRNADTAMYRAKESGRDNFQLYTPSMKAGVLQRLSLENDLRHALERNELRVYYQPISETATGRIVATEALVRWEHPERGLVDPDEFILFAEETGLIVPIGEWVLREAMQQNQAWRDAGYRGLRVGVNMSARQLQQDDMVSTVARLLRETGLAPELLQLEITEGAVMKNVDLIIAMLHQIRRMGIGISLDDFGTGYSSLSYLKRFPIDSVKIDRSFVRDIATDPNDAAIVTTVIAMAGSLNLQVIAEGVETTEQLEFLRQRGCDQFQGYLVSPPAPADTITRLLAPARRTRAKITRLRSA